MTTTPAPRLTHAVPPARSNPAAVRPLRPAAVIAALVLASAIVWAVVDLSGGDPAARPLGLSLALGAIFGITLQRSRFCFFCHARDLIEGGDPRGVLAILLALAVGVAGYTLVIGAWLPIPLPERLPPDAHIGPVSLVLAVAAFAFGFGMSLSGSCISAHLYRLGEGSPTAPFALLGTAAGFGLGFLSWNTLFLSVVSEAPVIWLPHHLGYAGTLAFSLSILAALALAAFAFARPRAAQEPAVAEPCVSDPHVSDLRRAAHAVFVARWPALVGGAIVGVISAASYLRVGPLGVTAEIGSLARSAADRLHLLPETLYGLDGFRGCATAVKTALLSRNGLFVIGLVGGSFASALLSGAFAPRAPRPAEVASGLAGGLLMGWGAMTALGCTVGVLLSGIHAGALSGWIFLAAAFAGMLAGLPIRRRIA
ncbi:YeeE/YedE family protein [Xanthobacter agilis]|uniref:Membrane protein YedE/YeeE n=1 Tax=Xanthobacter agilis TaxID=47492 RepID=A0ABU0LID7_XANAG|nr:YeeE/YedE family protein [Xanthobacter agilis]MDQ0506906.1 putative membrane protein YedE/YeeE [Xanthobacter agilis]